MPNTSLPTNLQQGSTGHIEHSNTLATEMNRLSRQTGVRDLKPFLINGWTATTFTIERRDCFTIIRITNLDGSASTNQTLFPFVEVAPGVSAALMGQHARRSPLFQTVTGDEFYFSVSGGEFRGFFPGAAKATGAIQVEWIVFFDGVWPSFLPPEA